MSAPTAPSLSRSRLITTVSDVSLASGLKNRVNSMSRLITSSGCIASIRRMATSRSPRGTASPDLSRIDIFNGSTRQKHIFGHGLWDVCVRAESEATQFVRVRVQRCQEQYRRISVFPADFFTDGIATCSRHHHVKKNEIGPILPVESQGPITVGSTADDVAATHQKPAQSFSHGPLVVRQQYVRATQHENAQDMCGTTGLL